MNTLKLRGNIMDHKHDIRSLTKLEQLEYRVNFCKEMLLQLKRELQLAEEELEEERKLVLKKKEEA